MTRTSFAALAAAVAATALPACAANHEAAGSDQDPVGCYQMQRTAGARALDLPWGFELTDEPLEGWGNLPGARLALTATSATGRADVPFHYWRSSEADSVQVGHPGGGGFHLVLGRDGRDLVGYGRAVGDAIPFGASGAGRGPEPVVALRVVCGEP